MRNTPERIHRVINSVTNIINTGDGGQQQYHNSQQISADSFFLLFTTFFHAQNLGEELFSLYKIHWEYKSF